MTTGQQEQQEVQDQSKAAQIAAQQAKSAAWLAANRPDLVQAPARSPEEAAQINADYQANRLPVLPVYSLWGAPQYADYSNVSQAERARYAQLEGSNLILTWDTTGMTPEQARNQAGTPVYLTPGEYYKKFGMTEEQKEQQKYRIFNDPFSVNPKELSPDLRATYNQQILEATHEYYLRHPSANFLAITAQYEQQRQYVVQSEFVIDPKTFVPTVAAGAGGFTGRAAQYKAAFDREVYGIGAPDNEREYYRRQAEIAATERPGYTVPSDLGDLTTQQFSKSYETFRQIAGMQGIETESTFQATGEFIEAQRQAAYATPQRRDERFFMGELQKWAEIPVEKSAAYHHIGMESGKQIPANPFEYQADLSVEFLKGAPKRAVEFFSPVSGEMSKQLPGGMGVQELAWNEAITDYKRQTGEANTPYPERVSFMPAVEYLGTAEGKYGPYGKLYGGIDNDKVDLAGNGFAKGTPAPAPAGAPAPAQAPKAELAGAPIPPQPSQQFDLGGWLVGAGNTAGRIIMAPFQGAPVIISATGGFGAMAAGEESIRISRGDTMGLPSPFVSKSEPAEPASLISTYKKWEGNAFEVAKGAVGSVVDFIPSMVHWTPVADMMRTTDAGQRQFIKEKTTRESNIQSMYNYGKSTFGTDKQGRILIDTTNPAAAEFQTKYEAAKTEYTSFIKTGFEKGYVEYRNNQMVLNPELTYEYGEFTKWGVGAGKQVRETLGFSREQLESYGTQLERKQGMTNMDKVLSSTFPVFSLASKGYRERLGASAEQVTYGVGYTLSTHPEKIVTAYGAGAAMVFGGEVIGAAAESTGIAGVLGNAAALHPTLAAVGQWGVPAAFVGLTHYGATEGLTATPERTTINYGKLYPELVAMGWGGVTASMAPRGMVWLNRNLPEFRQRPVEGTPVIRAGPQLYIEEIKSIPLSETIESKIEAAKARVAEFESKGISFENPEYKQALRESNPYYHQTKAWHKTLELQAGAEITRSVQIEDVSPLAETSAKRAAAMSMAETQRYLSTATPYYAKASWYFRELPYERGATPMLFENVPAGSSIDLGVPSRNTIWMRQEMNRAINEQNLLRAGSFFERISPDIDRVTIPQGYQTVNTMQKETLSSRYPFAAYNMQSEGQRIASKMGWVAYKNVYGQMKYDVPESTVALAQQSPTTTRIKERNIFATLTSNLLKDMTITTYPDVMRNLTRTPEKEITPTIFAPVTKTKIKEVAPEIYKPTWPTNEITITKETPPPPPPPPPPVFGGGRFGLPPLGGGGGGYRGSLGAITWTRTNLIADQPYLARGMRDIGIEWGKGTGTFSVSKPRKKTKHRRKR